MPCAGLHDDRFPVGDAPAASATDRAQSLVALYIGLGRVRVAFDRHRPELEETHGPPILRQSEQLQSVADSGVDGSVRRTAPQWHEPWCIVRHFCSIYSVPSLPAQRAA